MTTQTDYSRLLQERHARSTVMFVGGYRIRRIKTRFGDVYAVIGTNSAFGTLAQAEAHARWEGGPMTPVQAARFATAQSSAPPAPVTW